MHKLKFQINYNNLRIEKHAYKDPTGAIIWEKEHIKDLGIHISSDLTWIEQTSEVVSKARSMSGWTMRMFKTRERTHVDNLELTSQTMSGLLLTTEVPGTIKFSRNRPPGGNTQNIHQTNKWKKWTGLCLTSERTEKIKHTKKR